MSSLTQSEHGIYLVTSLLEDQYNRRDLIHLNANIRYSIVEHKKLFGLAETTQAYQELIWKQSKLQALSQFIETLLEEKESKRNA